MSGGGGCWNIGPMKYFGELGRGEAHNFGSHIGGGGGGGKSFWVFGEKMF